MLSFYLFSLLNRFLVLTETHVRDFPIQLCVPVICNIKWRSHIHTVDSIENTTKEKNESIAKSHTSIEQLDFVVRQSNLNESCLKTRTDHESLVVVDTFKKVD